MSVTDTGSADIIMADLRESSGAFANMRHSGIAEMTMAQNSLRWFGGISSSLIFLMEAADRVKTAESRVVMSSMSSEKPYKQDDFSEWQGRDNR